MADTKFSRVPVDDNMPREVRQYHDKESRRIDSAKDDITTIQTAVDAIVFASQSEAEAGSDNTKYMSPLRTAQAIAALTTPKFTKEYTSSQQTITSAGALTLAHGLGVEPKLVQLELVCVTGEQNYTAGDVLVASNSLDPASRGVSIVKDATNLNVRYGSAANVFAALNKTTGTAALLTDANWKTVFRAWA